MERQGIALLFLGELRLLEVGVPALPAYLAGLNPRLLPPLVQGELQLLEEGQQSQAVHHSDLVHLSYFLRIEFPNKENKIKLCPGMLPTKNLLFLPP